MLKGAMRNGNVFDKNYNFVNKNNNGVKKK